MTGRGAGFCTGFDVPGYANPGPGYYGRGYGRGFGRGLGRGFGRGRGFGWGFRGYPYYGFPERSYYPSRQDEAAVMEDDLAFLEEQKDALERDIQALRKQIEEMKAGEE